MRVAMRQLSLAPILLAAGSALAAGSSCSGSPTRSHESTVSTSSAITGGGSTNVTFATTLPERAVGQLQFPDVPGGGCSGTLILRNVVLSAAHCFVRSKGFLPENTKGINFVLPIPPNAFPKFSVDHYHAITSDLAADIMGVFNSDGQADQDLAVAFLTTNVSVAQLPDLPDIYTGEDFQDRMFNMPPAPPPAGPPFFGPPNRIVGFDGSGGPMPQKNGGTIVDPINFRADGPGNCGFLGLGTCSGFFIEVDDGGRSPTPQRGDSGGPITFVRDGSTVTLFGVFVGFFTPFLQPQHFLWSPTWNNGKGNGKWIQQWIPDADHDGILDTIDNCPPSKCPLDPLLCANTDQADRDGDGIGDICDNCSPSVCEARGWNIKICKNPDQHDSDGDHTGDVCDLCPFTSDGNANLGTDGNPRPFADADSDGVGDACDNCMKPNGYIACQTSNECTLGTTTFPCLSAGQSGEFGICEGGSNLGAACGNNAECPGAFCSVPFAGRCSHQIDDPDGDGIGGPCDTCPADPDKRVLANSNIEDEQRETAPALGDKCDPVPLTVSRPVVSGFTGFHYFTSSAGLGTGGNVTAQASAGYRFCSCIDSHGALLSREDCLARQCGATSNSITGGLNGEWKRVSLAVSPEFAVTAPPSTFSLDLQTTDTYTTDVLCNDNLPHPGDVTETCRVGSAQRTIIWASKQDVTAGQYRRRRRPLLEPCPSHDIGTCLCISARLRHARQPAKQLRVRWPGRRHAARTASWSYQSGTRLFCVRAALASRLAF